MTAATAPPESVEDERNVLGAVLLADGLLPVLLVDEGLRPEHFYNVTHAHVFAAMAALHDRDEPVDDRTVWAELERTRAGRTYQVERADVDALAGPVPNLSNAQAHARRVVELATLRRKMRAAFEIVEGVQAEDLDKIAGGEALLAESQPLRALHDPEMVARELCDFIDQGGVPTFPTPWQAVSRLLAGGWRRGEWSVLSGHSSHGKSVVADQIAETVAREGAKVGVYLTEMRAQERALRFVARQTGIPFLRLVQARLHDGEHARYAEAAQAWAQLGVGLVEASGWGPEDVARDARRRGWEFVVVDLFNELDVGAGKTEDWDRAARLLGAISKTEAAPHVLVVAHVNEARSSGSARRPEPVLGDLRSTGMLKNGSDNVLFVWRDQEDDGTVLDEGTLKIRKARNALLGGIPVRFDGSRMRFVERLSA